MTPDAEDIVGKARALVADYEKRQREGRQMDGWHGTAVDYARHLLRAVGALGEISNKMGKAVDDSQNLYWCVVRARECLASLGGKT